MSKGICKVCGHEKDFHRPLRNGGYICRLATDGEMCGCNEKA